MLIDHVPLVGLRLTTNRLELRLPDPEELAALADVAAAGIHDPDEMPFIKPWTLQEPAALARGVILSQWRNLGLWKPENWSLNLAVFLDGEPVGLQNIRAEQFAVTRSVGTGSWLGRAHHGKGLGKEMRAAVLHLAFAGLDAQEAVSVAFSDNAASLAVSAKLGYVPDGLSRRSIEGRLRFDQRQVLTRGAWETHRTAEVALEGLAPCLDMFGMSGE